MRTTFFENWKALTSFITSLDNDDDHSYNGETMRRAESGVRIYWHAACLMNAMKERKGIYAD